jgi:hypothetical protein
LEVCELAAYLTFFMRDGKVGEVLAALRDHGKYQSTFFEIAMAWRFARAGFPVAFYPPTPSGVADFEASVGAVPAIVDGERLPGDAFEDFAMTTDSRNFKYATKLAPPKPAFYGAVLAARASARKMAPQRLSRSPKCILAS